MDVGVASTTAAIALENNLERTQRTQHARLSAQREALGDTLEEQEDSLDNALDTLEDFIGSQKKGVKASWPVLDAPHLSSSGLFRGSHRPSPHIQRQITSIEDTQYALMQEKNPFTRALLIQRLHAQNQALVYGSVGEPIHSIHHAKQTLHDHHQSWADTRRDSLAHHQELLNDPWILNASAGQHMNLIHPTDFGHQAIAMIPESPFEIGLTVGSLDFGAAGPVARETARVFRMTEQGVRTVMREGVPLLRSAKQTTRRALTSARHTVSKARDSAQVYLDYDLPNALERAFAPGGYSKAERELLQYGDILDAGAQEFLLPTSQDFLVHPTRTAHTARTSHTVPAPSYTVPSDVFPSGTIPSYRAPSYTLSLEESPFLFPDLPVSTRPTQVPLWDVRSSGSNVSNYVASVFQETSSTRSVAPPWKQASLFSEEPSYVVQDLEIDALAKFNQQPYHPRVMQAILEKSYGTDAVTSYSLVPLNRRNAFIGAQESFHPQTGVPFDVRGFPMFDKHVVYETRISNIISLQNESRLHMKEATRQLKESILQGEISSALFNEVQLSAIMKGKERIPGFTWHHNQELGRIQLVPTEIHQTTAHVGGMDLWGTQK